MEFALEPRRRIKITSHNHHSRARAVVGLQSDFRCCNALIHYTQCFLESDYCDEFAGHDRSCCSSLFNRVHTSRICCASSYASRYSEGNCYIKPLVDHASSSCSHTHTTLFTLSVVHLLYNPLQRLLLLLSPSMYNDAQHHLGSPPQSRDLFLHGGLSAVNSLVPCSIR